VTIRHFFHGPFVGHTIWVVVAYPVMNQSSSRFSFLHQHHQPSPVYVRHNKASNLCVSRERDIPNDSLCDPAHRYSRPRGLSYSEPTKSHRQSILSLSVTSTQPPSKNASYCKTEQNHKTNVALEAAKCKEAKRLIGSFLSVNYCEQGTKTLPFHRV
jgi:hypothetical protein